LANSPLSLQRKTSPLSRPSPPGPPCSSASARGLWTFIAGPKRGTGAPCPGCAGYNAGTTGRTACVALPLPRYDRSRGRPDYVNGEKDRFFGPDPAGLYTRIMVTLPTEAGADPAFVRRLVAAGMNCARINCAHDNPEVWSAMIDNVRASAHKLGRDCRVLMDIAGPKCRIETSHVKNNASCTEATRSFW